MQYLFLGQFDVVFCLKTLDSIAARQCSCPALFEIFGIFFFYNCFLSWTICRCFINYILLFLLNTIHNVAAGPWSYQALLVRVLAYFSPSIILLFLTILSCFIKIMPLFMLNTFHNVMNTFTLFYWQNIFVFAEKLF